MSVDASIDFSFGPHSDAQALLEAIFAERWNSGGDEWYCVPLGSDVSEWRPATGREGVFDLLRSKLARGEVFGVRLVWAGTDIGGEFLIFSNQQASFVATRNRLQLDGRASDVSWYLQRLLPALKGEERVHLERWVWSESS